MWRILGRGALKEAVKEEQAVKPCSQGAYHEGTTSRVEEAVQDPVLTPGDVQGGDK